MFTADTRNERFLDSFGARWRFTDKMTFSALAPDWPLKNLGRSQVEVAAAVEEYGALMAQGSAAPAPILWDNKRMGYFDVIDGLQRLFAEQKREPTRFSAYIVTTDSPALARKLSVFANYRLQGGYQESSEWTLEQAVSVLVADGTMTVEEIAKDSGWTIGVIKDKKLVLDYRAAIQVAGGPEGLPDTMMRIVAANVECEHLQMAPAAVGEFFSAIGHGRFTTSEAEPFIIDFFDITKKRNGLAKRLAKKLKDFREDPEVAARLQDPTRRRYQPMTPEGRLLKSLKAACTVAESIANSTAAIKGMEEYYQIHSKTQKILKQIERQSRKRKK